MSFQIPTNHEISLVKRGNLKRSKLATGQPVGDNGFIGGGIGEDCQIQKDGSSTHIQNTALGQGTKCSVLNNNIICFIKYS